MPRATVTIQDLVVGGGTVGTAGTISVSDGAVIQGGGKYSKLLLRIAQTGGTAGTVSIPAGSDPPAFRKGMGAVSVVVPQTSGVRYVLIESARHAQSNGDIYLDFGATCAGTVEALRLPADA